MAWDWLKDNNDEPNEFKPIDARGLLDGKEYHDYWTTKLHNGLANVPKSLLGAVESIPAMAARTRPSVMRELENDLDGTGLMDSDADKAALSDVESQIKGTTAPIWEGARLGVKAAKDALPDANWESNVDESQLSYPKKIGGMVLENAPLMAAQLGASIINPALGVALMAGSIAGDAYNDLTEKGVDPLTAGQAGWLDAAAQAPLEGVGEMGWLKAFRELGTEGAAKLMGKAFVKEGLTEAIQEFPDETIPYIAEHGSLDGFDWSQLASNAVDAGVVGGIYGGGFAGIGRAINGKAQAPQQEVGQDGAGADNGNGDAPSSSPAMHAMNRLVNELGIDPKAASGIVGGLMLESGGNTTDISPTAKNPTSGSYGIGQWLGSRQDELMAFAEETGGDPNDLDTQISFLIHELKGSENGALQEIVKAQSPDEAGRLADKFYERSEGTDEIRNQKAANAQKIYDIFMNGGADPNVVYNGKQGSSSVPNPKSAEDFLKDLEATVPADTDEDVEKLNAIHKAIQDKNQKAQEELAAQYGWSANSPEAVQGAPEGDVQENANRMVNNPLSGQSTARQITIPQGNSNAISGAKQISTNSGMYPSEGRADGGNKAVYTPKKPTGAQYVSQGGTQGKGNEGGMTAVQPNPTPVIPVPNSIKEPARNASTSLPSTEQPTYESRKVNGIADRQRRDRQIGSNKVSSATQGRINKALKNNRLRQVVKQAFVDGDKDALNRLGAMQINQDVLQAVKNDVMNEYHKVEPVVPPKVIPAQEPYTPRYSNRKDAMNLPRERDAENARGDVAIGGGDGVIAPRAASTPSEAMRLDNTAREQRKENANKDYDIGKAPNRAEQRKAAIAQKKQERRDAKNANFRKYEPKPYTSRYDNREDLNRGMRDTYENKSGDEVHKDQTSGVSSTGKNERAENENHVDSRDMSEYADPNAPNVVATPKDRKGIENDMRNRQQNRNKYEASAKNGFEKPSISEKENKHENTKKNQPVHHPDENKNVNAKPEQSKPSESKDSKTPEIKNPVKKAPPKETPSIGKKEEPAKPGAQDTENATPKVESKEPSKKGNGVEQDKPIGTTEPPKKSEDAKPKDEIKKDDAAIKDAKKICDDAIREVDAIADEFVKAVKSNPDSLPDVSNFVEKLKAVLDRAKAETRDIKTSTSETAEKIHKMWLGVNDHILQKADEADKLFADFYSRKSYIPEHDIPMVEEFARKLYKCLNKFANSSGNMQSFVEAIREMKALESQINGMTTDKAVRRALEDSYAAHMYHIYRMYFERKTVEPRKSDTEYSMEDVRILAKKKESKKTVEEDEKALALLGQDLYDRAYKPIADYLRIVGDASRGDAFESAVLFAKMMESFHKNYGIWFPIPHLVKAVARRGKTFTILGTFSPNANAFILSKFSNGEVFAHEATHMYESMLRTFSTLTNEDVDKYFSGDKKKAREAIEKIRADLKAIDEWTSYSKEHLQEYEGTVLYTEFRKHANAVKRGTDIGERTWRTERLARGFTQYLGEGNRAPTKELEGVFARIKQWVLDAYGAIKNLTNGKLPPDMEKFYQSMISGDTEYFKNMANRGKSATVRTDDGKEFKVSYKIVPAETLIASNTADFGKNENYPAKLQPRDRDRVSMKEQVDDIARNLSPEDLAESRSVNQGAPLVNQDNVVENGNGRTMAITRAYTTDGDAYKASSQKYKQYLMEHAEEYGYTREEVEAMQNPVLVRQRDASSDSLQDSIIHSTEGGMKMSASQQAKVDAEKISPKTLSLYDYDGTGDLTKRSNNDFAVSALNEIADKSERDVVFNKDGTPSKAGIERVKSALAAYAYGDNSLLERISESTDTEDQNIVKAFSAAAPQVAAIKAKLNKGDVSKDYDLPKLLSDVLDFYFKCKNDGKSIKFALNETSLFGDNQSIASISGKNLARFIADNIRRPKAISDALVRMTKYIDGANEPGAALFSGSKMGLDEIIRTSVGLNTSKFIPASKPNARKYKHTIQPKENTWNSMPATQRKACIKLMDANGGHYDTKTKSFGFTDEKSRDAALNVLEAYLSADSKASAKIAIIPEMKVINKFSVKTPYQKMVENITPIASDDLTAREQAIVDFAKKMGLQVQFFEGDPNLHGFHADGTNVVFLNRHSAMDLNQTFWHETFHWMRESNPDLYNQMVKEVFGDEVSEKQLADYAASIGRTDMSKELTIEEMLADAMWDASKRGSFFEKLGIEHPSLCAKIIKWIKNLYEDFKAHFHNPRAGLTNTQIKRMSNTLSSIAEKLVDGDGNKLFSVDEKGNIKETAAGKIAVSGEAKVEAGQDGSGQKYRVTNRNIVASDPVRIVDITDAKRIRVKDGKNTKQADALVDSLLGKTFRFIGGEGFVAERDDNAVKGIENPNIRGQIIHSHATLSKIYNDKVRGKALGKLEELLRNGVYIDKHPDSAHGTKTKYIEIFVPVRDGDGLHVFKISARERGDSASVYEIGNALFYNVKKEGDLTMLPSEGYEKTASNKSPSMITIAEMLNGIKDRNNVPYVVNGKLNYDDNIFLTKNMLSSEPATSHSAEDLRAQTLSAFPNAQNIEPHDNGVSFDLPNGSHVEINFTDDTISVDRAKAQKDYGGTLKGNEKASGKIETVGKDALITLTMDSPDETVSHEAMHLAWNLLTDRERSALLRTYGSEEGAAEGVREWKIRRKMKQGTIAGKIMQKISDMAHKLLSLFSENDQHVFQKLESGEIWERGNENNTAARNVKYKMNPINEAEKYLKSHKNFGEKAGSYIDRTFRPDLAKAKANANISVNETKKKKGWGAVDTALNNTVRSPSRIKSPKTSYIWGLADTAQRELQELRGKWTHSFAGAIKNLNSKEKERYTDILWEEDMKQHVFSDKELRDAGVSEKIIKAHQKTRSLLSRIYTAVNAVYTRERIENFTYKTRKEAEEAKKELAKRPHTFVMHDIRETVKDGEPAFQVSIKTGGYREVHSVVTAEEMKKLDTDKDVYIKSRKQLDDGSFKVSYLAYNKPLANMEGYMPHIFHGVLIVKKYVDEDGNTQSKVVGSAESIDKAVVKADAMQKEEGGEFIIAPKEFSSEGEIENPLLLGDMDYFKLMENLRKGASLTLDEAREMTHATMKGRHVYYGAKKHRKGAEGFEKNAIWVIQHHIDSSSRYVALDPFKQKAISFFERAFGDYDKDWTGEAAFCKGYIDSVLGKPSRLETLANDFLRLFPWFKNEARPARRMAGNLTGLTGVLKLGASVASGFVNTLQLFNCVGYVGARKTAVGLKRALHPNATDKKILVASGVSEESGLALDSIGHVKAEGTALSKAGNVVNRVNDFLMKPFTFAEKTIRKATILAAYYKAIEDGLSKGEAIQYARDINRKVNFDYSVADAPRIFRALQGTVIGDMALQFQKYGVKEMEVISDFLPFLGSATTKQKLEFFIPYLLVSGIWNAFPFEDALLSLLKLLGFGDPEKEAKRAMMEWAGNNPDRKALVNVANYGAGSLAGVDISQRVGLKGAVPETSNIMTGGPLGSTTVQLAKAVLNGDTNGAMKAISPAAGNIYGAVAGYNTDSKGRKTVDYDSHDRIARGLGFRTIKEANATDAQSIVYNYKEQKKNDRAKAKSEYLKDPSSSNRQKLKEMGYSAKEIKALKDDKKSTRVERSQTGLSKEDKKKLKAVFDYVQ